MLILAALAVLAAVAATLLAAGAGLAWRGPGGRRPPVPGDGALPTLAVVGALAAVAAVAVLVLVVGARGAGDEAAGPAPSPTTAAHRPAPASTAADAGPEVALRPLGDGEFAGPDHVGLARREVLRVTARGFPPDTTGRVAQCAARPAGGDDCRDPFPVRFDGTGTARFQYLVVASAGPGGCGPRSGCVLRLDAGGRSSVVPLVFGRRVGPAGRLAVTPGRGVEVGEDVRVTVEGVAPGARLAVVRCAPPGLPVAEHCDEPGPAVVAGPDGRATATVGLSARPVGTAGHPCRRGSRCGLAAVGEGALLRTPVATLAFAGGPGASYDGARIAAGLAAAALLLAMAAWLVRRTDWREPTEASTPALDAAKLDAF